MVTGLINIIRMAKIPVILFCVVLFLGLGISTQAQVQPCGQFKITTLPLSSEYGGKGSFVVTRQTIQHPDPNVPGPVSVYIPSNATATNHVPVIFFAHGFGGTSYSYYDGLLQQMASNGYIVVFAPYTANLFATHPTRYQQMWSGFQLAVQQYGSLMDTSRVGFAGHSYGAGAVPELTRRGVVAGWGSKGLFMFIMAAWYSWNTTYDQIPATTKMVVQIYWDDGTNDHLISQNDIWNRLPQIQERRWQVIRSARTTCALNSGHEVPVTGNQNADGSGNVNAHDYWGVWRRIHALADYTFTGNVAARPIAFGDDTRMGNWRFFSMRPVAPLEAVTSPVVNTTNNPNFTWGNKCLYALGSPCP